MTTMRARKTTPLARRPRRRIAATLTAALIVVGVLVAVPAPAQAATGDLGWAQTTAPVEVASQTAEYSPTLECLAATCLVTNTTTVTVVALDGAAFTAPVGTTIPFQTRAGVARGSCVVTDATTVTCRTSNGFVQASTPTTFLRSATPFAMSVPDAIGDLQSVLRATWTDTTVGGTNQTANDILTVVRSGDTDWAASPAEVQVSTAATVLPPISFECASTQCTLSPSALFRIEAIAGTTFTNSVSSSLIFGPASLSGTCIVQSTTLILCAAGVTAFVADGTILTLARPGYALGAGAGIGTQFATVTSPDDENAANSHTSLVLRAPGTVDNGDWSASPGRILIPATATDTPQASFTCLTATCLSGPTAGFRVEAIAGVTFSATVGSTVPFGAAPLAGVCTVESTTAVRCAPTATGEVTAGAVVRLPRFAVALPPGLSFGTTILQTSLVAPDADGSNDRSDYVVYTAMGLADRLIFFEGFEQGQGTGATRLTDYVGAAPSLQTYTADAAWLTNCNGTIQSHGLIATTLPGCDASATADLRDLSWVLGAFGADLAGTADPADNHSLGSFTAATVATGQTVVLSSAGIDVEPGHYYATSFDVAARSCAVRAAKYFPAFVEGVDVHLLSASAIDPCVLAQTTVTDLRGSDNSLGRYFTDAFLATGSTLTFRMFNTESSGSGNDSAIDNLAVYDVTPAVAKSFSPATNLTVGQSTRLTITITNSVDRGAKAGWTVSDALPSGLTVAASPNATSTCASATITAAPGAQTVSAVASLSASSAGCEISVSVVSATTAGTFSNCAANLAGSRGLLLPTTCAQVSYTAAPGGSQPGGNGTGTGTGTGNGTGTGTTGSGPGALASSGGVLDPAFPLSALLLTLAGLGLLLVRRFAHAEDSPHQAGSNNRR